MPTVPVSILQKTSRRWQQLGGGGRYTQGKGEKVVLSQSRSRDTVYGDTIRNEVKNITYRYKGNQQKELQ